MGACVNLRARARKCEFPGRNFTFQSRERGLWQIIQGAFFPGEMLRIWRRHRGASAAA